ncbi:MAG: hypothetical protein Kilf2KO_28550 [Rhodospirillales bacterium]
MKLDRLGTTFASARGKIFAGSLAALVALSPVAVTSPAYAEDTRSPTQVAETVPVTSPHDAGRVMFADIRGKSEGFVEDAPGAASSGRVSVIVYGGSDPILRAVYEAAQAYSTSGPSRDIYFLQADDNDDDATTVKISVWSNGWEYGVIEVDNAGNAQSQDFSDLRSYAKEHMDGARNEHLAQQLSGPQVASAEPN